MYSKCVGRLLKKLLHILMTLIKMCNSGSDDSDKLQLYAFKAFDYKEIKPSKDSKVPFPRSGHRIGADSANFYSFGGYNPLLRNDDETIEDDDDAYWIQSYPLFQELWKFNFASNKWTKFPNRRTLPSELASNAMLLHRNMLMVYGGTGSPFGYRCSNQLYICKVNDKNGRMLEIHTTGQLPLPLYGQALIYHNDYLYTIGGTTGLSYTCDIHRLNMKTLVWEIVYVCNGQMDFEPKGRYRHEVGFDGSTIYVLGGGTADDAYDFLDIPAFNIEKKEWIWKRSIRDVKNGVPAPRRCHGAVQVNTDKGVQIFITGGHDGQNVFNDLWRLDVNTFQWTLFEICTLPRPTYFHATAVTPEGRLYVFGGICSIEDDVRRSNSVYSAWLVIPKLSEMSWEAVLYYSPHINQCKINDLINIGLPRHFIQRLDNSDNE